MSNSENEDTKATVLTAAEQALFENPLILRRQTLMVRDMEKSLALYRDAIGMTQVYDKVLSMPHPEEDRIQHRRIVVLKAVDQFVGALGLLEPECDNPNHPSRTAPVDYKWFGVGNVGLLFNTKDQDARWPLIKKSPGVKVIDEPIYTEMPSYDGKGPLEIKICRFYDPDGFLVEYNQMLCEMH